MTCDPGAGAVRPRAFPSLPWLGQDGVVAVAPDHLASLLFDTGGIIGLARSHPDVRPGRDRELAEALFPPVHADVLSYYLPWV